jgi:hypothetical protein
MDVPVFRPSFVYHVGRMRPSAAGPSSHEGPCLSVSLCPSAWSHIARLGGPVHRLSMPDAAFILVKQLSGEHVAEISRWAAESGFVTAWDAYRAWFYDDERDEWSYFTCDNAEAAALEVTSICGSDSLVDAERAFGGLPPCGRLVERADLLKLTDAGRARCPSFPQDLDATDMAILLWAEDVGAMADPSIAGIWWDEEFDEAVLSAPRGGILPSRLKEFTAERLKLSSVPDDDKIMEQAPAAEIISLREVTGYCRDDPSSPRPM